MTSTRRPRTGRVTAAAVSGGVVGTAMILGGSAAYGSQGTGPSSHPTTTTTTPASTTTSTTAPPSSTSSTSTTTPSSTTTTAPATTTTTLPATDATTKPGVGVRASADTGFGKTISVSVDPKVIVANGVSTSTATAYLTIGSSGDNPCGDSAGPCYSTGGSVTFSSSDAKEKVSATTNPPGQQGGPFTTDASQAGYTATVTSSTTAEVATITATDTITGLASQLPAQNPTISASTSLTQIAGPAAKITLALQPGSIVANGTSASLATATVTDAFGNRVSFDHVTFASSDSGEKVGTVTDHSNGTYTAYIVSSTKAQTDVITTRDVSVSPNIEASGDLVQTPGPAAQISLVVSPGSIAANGTATSTATATVTDKFGNPVSGNNVAIGSSDPNEKVSAVTAGAAPGTYTATITASTAVETATITATDSSVSPAISATAPLLQTGEAAKTLPFTGMSTGEEAAASAGLLGFGVALVAAVRRRRRPRFAHSIKR